MLKPKNDGLPKEQIKRIETQLVSRFRQEQPPANFVEVVPGSIYAIDTKFKLYKALVRTDVYIGGVKQHVSNIRFKLDPLNNVISNSITFN